MTLIVFFIVLVIFAVHCVWLGTLVTVHQPKSFSEFRRLARDELKFGLRKTYQWWTS